MLFAIPVAVAFSQCIGVDDCGCPCSCKASIVILAPFVFSNNATSSASTADAAANLSIWHTVNIYTLKCMGRLSCGFHPMKKCPSDLILAYLAGKLYEYEWTFSIMSEA